MLAGDIEDIVDMCQMYLNKKGFRAKTARNGVWALKLAQKNKYDIIVRDIIMPAMNGYDLLKHLKANSKNKNVLIIALSNSAQEADIDRAKKLGADSYVLKSQATPAMLAKIIKEVFNN